MEEPIDSQAEEEEEEKETRSQQLARLNPLLLEASRKNVTSEILSLIEEMADPCVEDSNQWSPLMWASNHGNEPVVRSLLEQNCHATYQQSAHTRRKCTPLHWAAFRGHLKVCWLLLKQKISPLEVDALGNTVLHQAAAGGSLEVTSAILSQGADVFKLNKRGHTPFDMCTVVPVQKLLKHCMMAPTCHISGRGFSSTVLRFLCSWTHVLVCREACSRMWAFENPTKTEREQPMTLAKDAKDIVDHAEMLLEKSTASGKLEDVIAALDNAEGKPVDCKIKQTAKKLRQKLESTIRLKEAMANKSIIKNDVAEIIEADALVMAAENLARAIQDAIRRRVEKPLTDEAANLRRRLLCEASLTRYFRATPKLTVGYIRYFQELIDTCEREAGNKHLLTLSTAMRKRISAEREMTLKFDEVEHLCLLSSITEVPPEDKKYPSWIEDEDVEVFSGFQEQYVKDVEYGRETESSPELIEKCEKQLAILEDLLIEQRQILEEVNLKKKKGKKSKK
ncbi:unnamed protein product [Amoebophrya sp. A120]|nr:unnamed protein product [Amoebophrya sp. A120]|eukprot:GSA120T00000513001.1